MDTAKITKLIRMPFFLLALVAGYASAQVETLMYDHIHMAVPNPQEAAQWYHDNIGGEFVDGRDDRLLFGTTRIMWLSDRGNTRKPTAGGVVDHLGFSFTDLQATLNQIDANGAALEGDMRDIPGLFKLAFAVDPWGTRLELVEDIQHLGLHHIHLRAPDPEVALAWYKDTFGGVSKNLKGRLPGLLYPGNVWILVSRGETFPTSEGVIDHIGWRAPESVSTMDSLVAKGAELTSGLNDMQLPNGPIRFFYIQGPDGARVELVQRAPDMP